MVVIPSKHFIMIFLLFWSIDKEKKKIYRRKHKKNVTSITNVIQWCEFEKKCDIINSFYGMERGLLHEMSLKWCVN